MPPQPVPAPAADWAGAIDTSVPTAARLYDFWLHGKDNFAVDRAAAIEIERQSPGAGRAARDNRRCLGRMVRYLGAEAGIRQFLDIGTGLPSASNVHEVAQAIAPESRIVYVDNDPVVLLHAQALLTSAPEGQTACIDADLRDPGRILREAARTLDLGEPVALGLVAILHFIADADDPYGIVAELMDGLPEGSYLALTTTSLENLSPEQQAGLQAQYSRTPSGVVVPRSLEDIRQFFDGLELVDPGLVPTTEWRPAAGEVTEWQPGDAVLLGAVGKKPVKDAIPQGAN